MNLLKQLLEMNDRSNVEVEDAISKLKAAERSSEDKKNTKGFALEDENGALVRIFVRQTQAADFEKALAAKLDDHINDDTEIAEILFDLRSDFEIVDVQWGENSIPEDEETNNELEEPVDSDVEGPEGEFGKEGQPGDEEKPKDGMDASDEDVPGPGGIPDTDSEAMSALDKIIDMMKTDAEARAKEAEARKAEAAVSAGKVAAQAASARAQAEEEIMDMNNYNKRQKEEKRERDMRAKLIKYRHEQKSEGDSDRDTFESFLIKENKFPEATPEEEEIMDMEDAEKEEANSKKEEATAEKLKKYRHDKKKKDVTEGLFDSKYDDITPEEEELLDMEEYHKEEAERKKREATREKLLKYRHAKKKKDKVTFSDFEKEIKDQRATQSDMIDLSHRAQR